MLTLLRAFPGHRLSDLRGEDGTELLQLLAVEALGRQAGDVGE